jgi:ribonuclease J
VAAAFAHEGGGDPAGRPLHPGEVDLETIQRHVRRAAGRFVNERTRRRPMIVPVVMEA